MTVVGGEAFALTTQWQRQRLQYFARSRRLHKCRHRQITRFPAGCDAKLVGDGGLYGERPGQFAHDKIVFQPLAFVFTRADLIGEFVFG